MLLIETQYNPDFPGSKYFPSDGHYNLQIQANNLQEAQHLLRIRGIGEVLGDVITEYAPENTINSSFFGIPELILEKRFRQAIHEATIAAFVGLASGALTPWQTVGDTGLVHELVHLEQGIYQNIEMEGKKIKHCVLMAEQYEKVIPGWPTLFKVRSTHKNHKEFIQSHELMLKLLNVPDTYREYIRQTYIIDPNINPNKTSI
jgi:hypothetical protein